MSTRPHDVVVASDPRVFLAAERTLLAWVRTGLALMGFGFVVARFGLFLREIAAARHEPIPPGHGGSLWIGVGLVLLGVAVLVVSGHRYRKYVHALTVGHDLPAPGPAFGLLVTAILATIGLVMAAYLLSVG